MSRESRAELVKLAKEEGVLMIVYKDKNKYNICNISEDKKDKKIIYALANLLGESVDRSNVN